MIVFFAGVPGGAIAGEYKRERELNQFWNKRLWTYYWIIKHNGKMPKTKNKKVELFLDSGAFSAKTQGIEISIKDYIQFIKDNEDVIDVYANLDVIGDAKATWKNQQIMEQAGLNPLPVYHVEDPEKYLLKCMDEYDYFCIGGMARGFTTKDRTMFLDRCFEIICDTTNKMPRCKVHGFGLTSLPLMLRYPWYSVDSTSWVVTGRLGSIYVPRYRNGQWIYDENSWKIAVSGRSPNTKEAGKHINTLPPKQKEVVLDYIHDKGYKLGHSEFKRVDQTRKLADNERWFEKKPKSRTAKRELEIIVEPGISNKYQLRDEMNIIYFLDLEKSIPEWPWAFKGATRTLF